MIVHGNRDQFFRVEIAMEMYRSILNSPLFVIPNGAHGLMRSPPVAFMPAATAFLGPPR